LTMLLFQSRLLWAALPAWSRALLSTAFTWGPGGGQG
jgi:hypothetical protein